jgi:hypothetical protein
MTRRARRRFRDAAWSMRAMAARTTLFDSTVYARGLARVAPLALCVGTNRACVRLVTSRAVRVALERGRRLLLVTTRAARRGALRFVRRLLMALRALGVPFAASSGDLGVTGRALRCVRSGEDVRCMAARASQVAGVKVGVALRFAVACVAGDRAHGAIFWMCGMTARALGVLGERSVRDADVVVARRAAQARVVLRIVRSVAGRANCVFTRAIGGERRTTGVTAGARLEAARLMRLMARRAVVVSRKSRAGEQLWFFARVAVDAERARVRCERMPAMAFETGFGRARRPRSVHCALVVTVGANADAELALAMRRVALAAFFVGVHADRRRRPLFGGVAAHAGPAIDVEVGAERVAFGAACERVDGAVQDVGPIEMALAAGSAICFCPFLGRAAVTVGAADVFAQVFEVAASRAHVAPGGGDFQRRRGAFGGALADDMNNRDRHTGRERERERNEDEHPSHGTTTTWQKRQGASPVLLRGLLQPGG